MVKFPIEHMEAAKHIHQLYSVKTLYGVALFFYYNRGYKRRSHFGLLLYVKEDHNVVSSSLQKTPLYILSPRCSQLLYIDEDRNVISYCIYRDEGHNVIISCIQRITTRCSAPLYGGCPQSKQLIFIQKDHNVCNSSIQRKTTM